MSWSPRGRPWLSRPAGTASPGRPAMLTVTVNTSLRHISTGSSDSFSPMPNAAVGASQIRRGLGRIDYIVCRQGVLGVGQGHRDDLGARALEPAGAGLPEGLDLGRHPVDAVFLRDPYAHALDGAADCRLVVGHV